MAEPTPRAACRARDTPQAGRGLSAAAGGPEPWAAGSELPGRLQWAAGTAEVTAGLGTQGWAGGDQGGRESPSLGGEGITELGLGGKHCLGGNLHLWEVRGSQSWIWREIREGISIFGRCLGIQSWVWRKTLPGKEISIIGRCWGSQRWVWRENTAREGISIFGRCGGSQSWVWRKTRPGREISILGRCWDHRAGLGGKSGRESPSLGGVEHSELDLEGKTLPGI